MTQEKKYSRDIKMLYELSDHGISILLEKIIKKDGIDVNSIRDNNGSTLLHKASDYNTAQVLISCGADLSLKDNKGMSPLHRASYDMRGEVVDLLIENIRSSSLTIEKDKEGNYPSYYSKPEKNYTCFEDIFAETGSLMGDIYERFRIYVSILKLENSK